ncbi:rho GTPase-activating protein 20-like [Polymixia lowei]
MERMSPQQKHESLGRSRASVSGDPKSSGQHDIKRRVKSLSYRRQSAPSLVITKALSRSRTVCRESVQAPVCPEMCPLVQSYLTCSDRLFLLHGHAQLKTGLQTQDRHLFLFNDILVIAKAKSANHFKLKAQVCVREMWTAGCMEEVCEGSTSPEKGFVMGWPTCNCVATFTSAEQKERWLSLLKSRIKEEKEREEPKTIPLKVHGKGINTFAVTKTLPVSSSDSTNEVVRLALQQFSIIGNVKDYQLWVISKRDTAYPLIGHEFPFSIQMSHVRDPLSQGSSSSSSRDAVPRQDRQRALQAEKQCQFILKLRPVATTQPHVSAESSQKPFKRRRSLINWTFWRGSSPQLNDLSLSLSGPAPGCLFNQPLSSVCPENALPKPVMDMLVFLYHEGSWTRGIFRRSAGARAVRELRMSLDAGLSQLPLTRDHAFIIAGVFKDFLRSIPGSLLCSALYEEWMDVLEEEEEEEEQVQDIQRLIGRLPKENALLLHYLVAMLHGIQGNAHDNQMTSFNLSVCIAPSMLWPPGPCSPEVEGEGAKKVCELVKFMIDRCQQLLREEPTSLFGGPPQRHLPEETGSDIWPYPLTDSSYDSLENELEDYSSGGSPTLFTPRGGLRAKPGSLESILILGDYNQDTDPDAHATQTDSQHCLKLQRTRGMRHGPAPALTCHGEGAPSRGTSATPDPPDPPCPEGWCRQRRRSEPAIAYAAEFQARASGNAEGPAGDDEDEGEEELSKGPGRARHRSQSRRDRMGLGLCGARSSPSISPAATRSSPDSLDSLSDDQTRRPAKARSLSISVSSAVPASSSPSRPSVPASTPAPVAGPHQGPLEDASPPKELLCWGTLKGSSRGLHPNSWLKKARRLSLTQQDNFDKEEEDRITGGSSDKSLTNSKLGPEKGGPGERKGRKWITTKGGGGGGGGEGQPRKKAAQEPPKPSRPPKHDSSGGPAPHHLHYTTSPCFRPSDPPLMLRQLKDIHAEACQQHARTGSDITGAGQAEGGDVNEPSRPPRALFYRQGGPALSLFRQHKSDSLAPGEERLAQRRASEPGPLQAGEDPAADWASTVRVELLYREGVCQRRPSDPGLRISDVDTQPGQSTEAHFCLSPSATRAVSNYFLSHPQSNPQSRRQVALALVKSQREWLRRHSDPMANFDQLLFAEESYV